MLQLKSEWNPVHISAWLRFLGTKATTKKKHKKIFVDFVWLEILALFTFSTNLFSDIFRAYWPAGAYQGPRWTKSHGPTESLGREEIDDSSEFLWGKVLHSFGSFLFRNGSSLKDLGVIRVITKGWPLRNSLSTFLGFLGGEILVNERKTWQRMLEMSRQDWCKK